MPRFGSVWLEAVCLVPNWTSCWMVAWMRLGSIWRSTDNRPGSGPGRWGRCEPVPSVAAPAEVECETSGTAAAATAEADRNRRRLGPFEPETSLFSMPLNQERIKPPVKLLRSLTGVRRRLASVRRDGAGHRTAPKHG